MSITKKVDVAIIGAGTAGLYALREARRAQKSFVLIDHGPLGTTCARVGCMPSKAALHAAALWSVRKEQAEYGIVGTDGLSIDRDAAWRKVRALRDEFASGAAEGAQKSAGEHLLMGQAQFLNPNLLAVTSDDGERYIEAKAVVIAVGSRPVIPDFLEPYRKDIITTDELFELEALPNRLGVLGLGAIGLEMGLTMARLGVQVAGADMADAIGGIKDPEIAKAAFQTLGQEFPMYLGAKAQVESDKDGLYLKTSENKILVDKILVALGRRSNLDLLSLEKAGIQFNSQGKLNYDPHTLQVENLPIFVAGDANSDRTLLHEAAAEGAIAGFNAVHKEPQKFARNTPLAIAFTQPDIISVGASFGELDKNNLVIGQVRSQANGRSRILSQQDGLLRIYANKKTGELLGASMVGQRAEHIGHMLALALQQKMTAHELLNGPFYHPAVEEMVQAALQDIVRKMPASPYPLGLTAI